ncbi:FAD binding domain protein, partial [Klebsiella pneumoniae MRSN 1319]
PLREGPFYAVRILPGSLGTFSGLQTDEHARVLDEQQLPIPGRNGMRHFCRWVKKRPLLRPLVIESGYASPV